jgi:hypothetical protein
LAIATAIVKSGGLVAITGLDRARVDRAVEALAKDAADASHVMGAAVDVRDRIRERRDDDRRPVEPRDRHEPDRHVLLHTRGDS